MSLADHQLPIEAMANAGLWRPQLNAILANQRSRLVALEAGLLSATVQTTNATPTTIATVAVASNATMLIAVDVIARRTGGSSGAAGDSAGYRLQTLVKNIAGTVTIVSQALTYTAEDQAGWDFAASVSGTNILLRVTGAANNNIDWLLGGYSRSVT